MNKIDWIGWISIITLGVIFIIPLGYWVMNPELSHMEVFIEFWWLYLIALIPLAIYKLSNGSGKAQ